MAGMTGEMNIITGTHENAILVPTRALLVDQALIIKHGIVQKRTVKIGFRTLDFTEILSGLSPRRSCRCGRSGSSAAGAAGASTSCGHLETYKVTPSLYIALAISYASQACVSSQSQRRRFRGRHFYLHSGANAGLCASISSIRRLEATAPWSCASRFRPRYSDLSWPAKNRNPAAAHRLYFEGIDDASEIMRVSRQFSNVVCLLAGSPRNSQRTRRF